MNKNEFSRRSVITIDELTQSELLSIIKKAHEMKELEQSGKRYELNEALKNKRLASLFYEPSTRTRTSFETAMHELGGNTFGFAGTEGTSVMKKESILATVMMYWANHADAVVMRHPKDGAVQWASDILGIPVINGGDGKNEHPTQALLDMVTIDEIVKGINGTKIGFGGDLAHGRTIRSNAIALSKFNNITINWAAADELRMPEDLVEYLKEKNVKVIKYDTVEEVIKNSNIYYMTRPQKERILDKTPQEINEIMQKYRITTEKLKVNPNIKILHPLPVDSTTEEIDINVFYSKQQYFFAQAENGIFLRKALLHEILKDTEYTPFNPSISEITANNRIYSKSKTENKGELLLDRIRQGVVIDHIPDGLAYKIDEALEFSKRGYKIMTLANAESSSLEKKGMLKITDANLTEREYKQIVQICPDVTFNIIRNWNVTEKFRYNLCQNSNCITRVINEDVPPIFENGKCHYCGRKN